MSEPKIRYAIDPSTGNTVDAQAALLPKKAYSCIKCQGELTVRQGTIQVWHFGHAGGDQKAKGCPLYYGGGYEDLLRELRTTEVERAEKRKDIRLILKVRAFGSSLELIGVLPTVAEIPDLDAQTEDRFMTTASFSCIGFKDEPSVASFRASEAEASFRLDHASPEFRLDVTCPTEVPGLTGTWKNTGLRLGDLFVGDADRAERVRRRTVVSDGEFVWVVRLSPQHDGGNKSFRLGSMTVESIEVSDKTRSQLAALGNLIQADSSMFYADIVLPASTPPNSSEPVEGPPLTRVLIAVTPPPRMNPEIDVAPVPLGSADGVRALRPTGEGKTRWLWLQIPAIGAGRIDLHWNTRHRLLMVHPAQVPKSAPLGAEVKPGIWVGVGGSRRFVSMWSQETIEVEWKGGRQKLGELGLDLQAPTGLRFSLAARFRSGARLSSFTRDEITRETIDREISVWLNEGLEELQMDFGPLGTIRIIFRDARRPTISDEEVRAKLEQMNPLPRKVRWPLVRQLFGVPAKTPHREIPFGPKRVRHILQEVRKHRNQR